MTTLRTGTIKILKSKKQKRQTFNIGSLFAEKDHQYHGKYDKNARKHRHRYCRRDK